MPANVETMFYVREKPWHGLGTRIEEAPTPVVQNGDAFQFTDDLLGAGVTYETAGALQGGRKVWMLARMPHRYIIVGDEITPYWVVMNSHDGSSGIKVAITPIRVVWQNTLNLALDTAKRIRTTKHTENVTSRVHEARETLMLAKAYMAELGGSIDALSNIKLSDKKALELMQEFYPITQNTPEAQRKNNLRLLDDLKLRYWEAPDLSHVGKNGTALSTPSATSPPMPPPSARQKTMGKTCFCGPWKATP